ncbi:MAG: hypothetical protein V3U80_06605 [Flavobacteriaceae bacterium]
MKTTFLKTLLISLSLVTLSCTAKENKTTTSLAINIENELKPKPDKTTIKVALLLDTSNSMDGLIDQAKSQLWKIINELSYAKCEHVSPNLEIALYEYGNDGLEKSDDFIRQVIGFSSDLDEISEKLFSLDTNGGSEFCGAVIKTSLKDLKWGKGDNDLNIIFIAGNEAFTQGKTLYSNAIADAVEKEVVVNTIFCGDYNNGISGKWKNAADLGKGEYMTINQNKQIVHIATPYDEIIIKLNKRLNDTYIFYGSNGRKKMALQSKQDDNAIAMDNEVVVARAVSKTSSVYNNATWDLVDAEKEDDFDYKKIDTKKLSKDLQDKSPAELKEHVSKLSKKRVALQQEIKQINSKRKAYLLKNKKENTEDELESVMLNAIKKQAKRKNYNW